MTTRTASCTCGQLTAVATVDPVRVSVCHCLACQKRSGSAFAAQARWPNDQVTVTGEAVCASAVSVAAPAAMAAASTRPVFIPNRRDG